jgi:hypothetical protein
MLLVFMSVPRTGQLFLKKPMEYSDGGANDSGQSLNWLANDGYWHGE